MAKKPIRLDINMEDKFDFHNCGNDDALSFDNAMLKVEKLKETENPAIGNRGYTDKTHSKRVEDILRNENLIT